MAELKLNAKERIACTLIPLAFLEWGGPVAFLISMMFVVAYMWASITGKHPMDTDKR